MNLNCVQNKLSKGLQKNNLVVSRNIDLPILSCVLLTTTNDQVLIQSTDIEHALTITVPAVIESEGTVAVTSEILSKIVQGGDGSDTVSLSREGENLVLTNSQGTSKVTTQDYSEFPTIPHIETDEDTRSIQLSVDHLLQGLQSVSFAASVSNIKPELSSVFVSYEAGRLYFVCTDGFRLAEKIIKTDLGAQEFSFLLPVKSAGMLVKLFDDQRGGEVDMYITDNQLALESKNMYFTCRLVSGNFPDYKKLIPQDKETSAVVLKEDLAHVLKLSNIFSNEFHEVVLNIDPKKKLCEITSQNKEIGMNQTNMQAALEGDAVTVTFNYRFLADVLPVVHTDSIELSFTDPGRPIRVTTVPGEGFTYIVMPLNK